MQRKFARHYRRMLRALLDSLRFRSDNRFQPIIEALGIIQRNLATRRAYFSERVPIEGVVTSSWKEMVFEQVNGETKINRHYYELFVLEKLERALKCKEVWVEGSYDFRNPSEGLPGDWSDEQRRMLHYQLHAIFHAFGHTGRLLPDRCQDKVLVQAATNGCGHRKAKENQRPKDNVWLHLAHSATYVRASSPTKSSNRVGVVFSGVRRGLIIPSLKARVISTYKRAKLSDKPACTRALVSSA